MPCTGTLVNGERVPQSGSGPFESPVLMLARGRGPVLTSHLFTKAFAYLEGETSRFQKGTVRAADVLHLGLGAASARSRASSKATATADWDGGISSKVLSAPFLPPDHPPWWRGPKSLTWSSSAFLLSPSQSAQPSQRGPFTSESRKPAHLPIKSCLLPTPLQMCSGGTRDGNK